jgi:hypothetical protein
MGSETDHRSRRCCQLHTAATAAIPAAVVGHVPVVLLMGVGTAALLARLSAGGWHPGAGRKGACIG